MMFFGLTAATVYSSSVSCYLIIL